MRGDEDAVRTLTVPGGGEVQLVHLRVAAEHTVTLLGLGALHDLGLDSRQHVVQDALGLVREQRGPLVAGSALLLAGRLHLLQLLLPPRRLREATLDGGARILLVAPSRLRGKAVRRRSESYSKLAPSENREKYHAMENSRGQGRMHTSKSSDTLARARGSVGYPTCSPATSAGRSARDKAAAFIVPSDGGGQMHTWKGLPLSSTRNWYGVHQ
mmetsp:Transcript_5858/g.13957  ORF Transcript_5858/g.13957 Transcript_5858/m.13957 type:complete len:213 (+) Transcript_5858:2243-2881(+)